MRIPAVGTPDDPVVADPAASYERASSAEYASADERAVISVQLGRPARGRSAVVHRCAYGLPTAIRVDPHLPDGTPFPTVFWQTCPALRSAIGRLEADQSMVGLNERLENDGDFARDYADGHERYVAFRDRLGEALPGNPGAGGMPLYIKCLHTHAGHHLATGDNVVGEWTLQAARPVSCGGPCVSDEAAAAARQEMIEQGLA